MSPKPGGPRLLIPTLVPIAKLSLDPENANLHPVRNLAAIEASLRRFGQVKPIVTSKNLTIVAGNGTYEAALNLEWTELAAIVFPGSIRDARAYAIADNRSAELAEWDRAVLIEQLAAMDPELRLAAGFEDEEIELLRKVMEDSGRKVEFTAHDDKIDTEHECPKCHFRWSGSSAPKTAP